MHARFTHTAGVGSPTDCSCSGCRQTVLSGLAVAVARPGAALTEARIGDAARVTGDQITIGEAHAVFALAVRFELAPSDPVTVFYADTEAQEGSMARGLAETRGPGWYVVEYGTVAQIVLGPEATREGAREALAAFWGEGGDASA